MKKRVGLYLRVSTDGQTTENQRRELEAVAVRSGWEVVGIYEDAGISGSNGRERRPGLDRQCIPGHRGGVAGNQKDAPVISRTPAKRQVDAPLGDRNNRNLLRTS
jgi:Resolvase, N terminal domain